MCVCVKSASYELLALDLPSIYLLNGEIMIILSKQLEKIQKDFNFV